MVSNQKPTGRATSMPAGLAMGAGISMLITLLAAFILAKLLDAQKLPWENIGYGVMMLLLLASSAGAATAYSRIKRQRFIVCILSGILYMGVLLSITALFFGGQYEAVGVTALLVFGGSGAVALLGSGEKRRGKHKTMVKRYR